jgi:hypothetical protein
MLLTRVTEYQRNDGFPSGDGRQQMENLEYGISIDSVPLCVTYFG